MTTTGGDPYRNATLTVPVAPTKVPFWSVVLAWFYTESKGSDHQWYRRARGGRWSYHHRRQWSNENWISEWVSVPHCPIEGPAEVYERTDRSNWSCHGDKCHCEVW